MFHNLFSSEGLRLGTNLLFVNRNYFGEVLINLYKELTLNKCFKVLLDYNLQVHARDKYRAFLAEDEAKNKVLVIIPT